MSVTLFRLRSAIARSRVQSECAGVALLAFVVFVALGVAARHKSIPVKAEQARLANAAAELVSFRAAFRASTPERDAGSPLPDSYAVSVERDLRMTLAQQLAAAGEQDGLTDVQVNFAAVDSTAAPARPALVDGSVALADYAVSLDCDGGFAAVLSLVNQLPASVALERIAAVRGRATTHFHITLAVFEPTGAGQHG
jgi:hypothetical protein